MEYGLIAALISVAAAGVLTTMGVSLNDLFTAADAPVAAATAIN